MAENARHVEQTAGLHFFEKYLTLWVILCIGAGVLLGRFMLMLVRFCLRSRNWFAWEED